MTRRSKYGARKTVFKGIKFDSQLEASRYSQLLLLEKAGKISDLQLQVRFQLQCNGQDLKIRSRGYPGGRRAKYVADFVYRENGEQIIEDSKGKETDLYKLKKAIMESMGYQIREVR